MRDINEQNGEVLVNCIKEPNGFDENNNQLYKLVYENPPQNYKLVELDEVGSVAILKDLDHVEPE